MGDVIPHVLRKHLTKEQQRLWLVDTIAKKEREIQEKRNGWGMELDEKELAASRQRLIELKHELGKIESNKE